MRIRTRLIVVLTVLLTGTVMTGAIALRAMSRLHQSNIALRTSVRETGLDYDTVAQLVRISGHMQAYALASDRATKKDLGAEIDQSFLIASKNLDQMRANYQHRPTELAATVAQQKGLSRFLRLWQSRALDRTAPTGRSSGDARVRDIGEPLEVSGAQLVRRDARTAVGIEHAARHNYVQSRDLVVGALLLILALGAAFATFLIYSVVPRTRRYSRFATQVSDGDLTQRIDVVGSDELAELGQALNAMVDQREGDREFAEALQVSSSEEEAHAMLQIHLKRSIPDGLIAILTRNNSANRLETRTATGEDMPALKLSSDTEPKACLAIRHGRPHSTDRARVPLVTCRVCGALAGAKSCQPLIVSSEVIGSVLVNSPDALEPSQHHRLQESVGQIAPILGNLRNLAIAELRAATDALTGLPNTRSVNETIKRMVAQAARSESQLAVVMLDLDHFKQINDSFGHERGDDVLAAVSATLQAWLRASDFAGRLGGEEFVVLLPDTSPDGALTLCEKLRQAINLLRVPGVDRDISASFGIAVMPDHAGESNDLLREADRALYAAKELGRNRIELAHPSKAAQQHANAASTRDANVETRALPIGAPVQ